jgi:hypothetical protein
MGVLALAGRLPAPIRDEWLGLHPARPPNGRAAGALPTTSPSSPTAQRPETDHQSAGLVVPFAA